MVKKYLSKLKLRFLIAFLFVHIGLGVSLFAFAWITAPVGMTGMSALLLVGILCLYAGVAFGTFTVVWPMLPWIRRAKEMNNWVRQLLADLPKILEHVPEIIDAIQPLFGTKPPPAESKSPKKTD